MSGKRTRLSGGRQVVIVADPNRSDLVRATLTELQKAVRQRTGRRLYIVMNPEALPEPALLDDPAGVIYIVHQPQRAATRHLLHALQSSAPAPELPSRRKSLLVYIQDGPHRDTLPPTCGPTAVETLWEDEFYFGHGGTVAVADSADAALHRGLDALDRTNSAPPQFALA